MVKDAKTLSCVVPFFQSSFSSLQNLFHPKKERAHLENKITRRIRAVISEATIKNLKSSKKRSSPSQGVDCKNLEENHIHICGMHMLKRKITRKVSSPTYKKSTEQEAIRSFFWGKGLSFIRLSVFYSTLFVFSLESISANCQGRFVNPLTDICWSCLFPMTIGGANVSGPGFEDTPNPSGRPLHKR
jgi:hypothetical protein